MPVASLDGPRFVVVERRHQFGAVDSADTDDMGYQRAES